MTHDWLGKEVTLPSPERISKAKDPGLTTSGLVKIIKD